jgi:hypothetical protein
MKRAEDDNDEDDDDDCLCTTAVDGGVDSQADATERRPKMETPAR